MLARVKTDEHVNCFPTRHDLPHPLQTRCLHYFVSEVLMNSSNSASLFSKPTQIVPWKHEW